MNELLTRMWKIRSIGVEEVNVVVKKVDLARAVYDRHGGITTREAVRVVDVVIETIKTQLLAGYRVYMGELGMMEVVPRSTRRGRRPANGKVAERTLRYHPPRGLRNGSCE